MCFGQTGAGKTYTMTGATESYRQRGLIPRAIQQVLSPQQLPAHFTETLAAAQIPPDFSLSVCLNHRSSVRWKIVTVTLSRSICHTWRSTMRLFWTCCLQCAGPGQSQVAWLWWRRHEGACQSRGSPYIQSITRMKPWTCCLRSWVTRADHRTELHTPCYLPFSLTRYYCCSRCYKYYSTWNKID